MWGVQDDESCFWIWWTKKLQIRVCTGSARGQLAHVGRKSPTSSYCSFCGKQWILPHDQIAMNIVLKTFCSNGNAHLHHGVYMPFKRPSLKFWDFLNYSLPAHFKHRFYTKKGQKSGCGIKIVSSTFLDLFLGRHLFLNPFDLNSLGDRGWQYYCIFTLVWVPS